MEKTGTTRGPGTPEGTTNSMTNSTKDRLQTVPLTLPAYQPRSGPDGPHFHRAARRPIGLIRRRYGGVAGVVSRFT